MQVPMELVTTPCVSGLILTYYVQEISPQAMWQVPFVNRMFRLLLDKLERLLPLPGKHFNTQLTPMGV